jgi:succinoglycan biosynthesis protein ExoM
MAEAPRCECAGGGASVKVLIAVTTAHRLEDLGRLLRVLAEAYAPRQEVHLLVVDNDASGSSQSVVRDHARDFRDRLRYVIEPEPGYASVRNTVLHNVGDAERIVFIDDDEVPCDGWLDGLLEACERHGADVVAGPVKSIYPRGAPEWFERSRVFAMESPEFEEGAEMPWCASGNTVIRRHVIDAVPGGFDRKFNRMGGEDSDFFLRARLAGCRIVWTQQATVCEYLKPERLCSGWVFRRAVHSGNSRALIELALLRTPGVVAKRCVKAVGLILVGVVERLLGALHRDKAVSLRGIHRIGSGYGMLRAFLVSEPWAP